MSTEKVVIDVRETVAKLSFLIGKTILMRTAEGDASVAARVEAVMVKNTPGMEGHPVVPFIPPLESNAYPTHPSSTTF